jgi:hypothetical protein
MRAIIRCNYLRIGKDFLNSISISSTEPDSLKKGSTMERDFMDERVIFGIAGQVSISSTFRECGHDRGLDIGDRNLLHG